MHVQPYLFFDGRCDEALEFYKKALGAEVEMLVRFGESPETPTIEVAADKVMHCSFRVGDTVIHASDGNCGNATKFDGFSLSITVASEAEADKVFNALAEGGQVHMPLDKTFFSPRFGMLMDRFGVGWMVIVPGEH